MPCALRFTGPRCSSLRSLSSSSTLSPLLTSYCRFSFFAFLYSSRLFLLSLLVCSLAATVLFVSAPHFFGFIPGACKFKTRYNLLWFMARLIFGTHFLRTSGLRETYRILPNERPTVGCRAFASFTIIFRGHHNCSILCIWLALAF